MTSCALTGHRELPENFDINPVYDALEELIRQGCHTFYCGMAMGFDLLALECLIDLKQKYTFTIEACIPFVGQENRFSALDKVRYHEYLQWCDKKTVLFPSYQTRCYLARDRYMVDRADVVLAYCTKNSGGTAYTVGYAREKGIKVILIR